MDLKALEKLRDDLEALTLAERVGVMSVRELRDALTELVDNGDGNLPVSMEGCDCYGWAGSVRSAGDQVEIRRK